MLKTEYQKSRKSDLDRKVCNLVVRACLVWDTLEDLTRVFDANIKQIPSGNHIRAEHAYKLQITSGEAELYHLSPTGEVDRHLLTVKYTPFEIQDL